MTTFFGVALWRKRQFGEVCGIGGKEGRRHTIKHMRKKQLRDVTEQFFLEA